MLRYNQTNKANARQLRTHMTDSERALWARLRRKQILGIQFYRQKPVGTYQVLQNPEAVTERIVSVVRERLEEKNPPQSPFFKGGSRTPSHQRISVTSRSRSSPAHAWSAVIAGTPNPTASATHARSPSDRP